jgi:hypothetical protein
MLLNLLRRMLMLRDESRAEVPCSSEFFTITHTPMLHKHAETSVPRYSGTNVCAKTHPPSALSKDPRACCWLRLTKSSCESSTGVASGSDEKPSLISCRSHARVNELSAGISHHKGVIGRKWYICMGYAISHSGAIC